MQGRDCDIIYFEATMTLFSKMTDNNVKTLTILYHPDVRTFSFMESHVAPYSGPKGSIVVCSYRYPSGTYGAEDIRQMLDRQFGKTGDSDGHYTLSCDAVWELYSNWRRAYASGYDATEMFNIYGIALPNPVRLASNHFTFDIRLGHCIVMDRRTRELIGSGKAQFIPRIR